MSDHKGTEGRRHWRGGVAVPYDDLEAMEDRAERAGLPFRWEPAGSWWQMISDGGRAIVWIGDPPKSSRPQCGAKTRKGTPCQARAFAIRPDEAVRRHARFPVVCVPDLSAVLAYIGHEPGRAIVEARLDAGGCQIHAMNLCEALYQLRRQMTREEAQQDIRDFLALGVRVRRDSDLPFLQIVADYKNAAGPTSLADCFGLALAHGEGVPFVTSDRHELTRVAERGTVAIDFIR